MFSFFFLTDVPAFSYVLNVFGIDVSFCGGWGPHAYPPSFWGVLVNVFTLNHSKIEWVTPRWKKHNAEGVVSYGLRNAASRNLVVMDMLYVYTYVLCIMYACIYVCMYLCFFMNVYMHVLIYA